MTQKFSTLDDAIRLAEYAHRHQIDKAGLPYIEHPKRVLATVQAQGAMPFVQIAAVLHDVTEDTRFSADMLLELGFSEAAVSLVKLLDRDYSKWLFMTAMAGENKPEATVPDMFYYTQIAKNPNATMIKVADIADNTQPWRLSYLEPETQERLIEKYARAKVLLGA